MRHYIYLFRNGTLLVMAAMLFMSANAFAASITYLGTTNLYGQGLGAKATVMTFKQLANDSTEWGTVERNSSGDLVAGSQVVGLNKTWTRSALTAEIGALTKDTFGVLFDISENKQDPSLTVQNFRVRFYTDEANYNSFFDVFYTPGQAVFTQVGPGTGSAGHLFKTNFDDLAQFNSWTRIGMLIPSGNAVSNVEGDHEDFSIVKLIAIPVPASATIGAALLACVVTWRVLRRRAAYAE